MYILYLIQILHYIYYIYYLYIVIQDYFFILILYIYIFCYILYLLITFSIFYIFCFLFTFYDCLAVSLPLKTKRFRHSLLFQMFIWLFADFQLLLCFLRHFKLFLTIIITLYSLQLWHIKIIIWKFKMPLY